MDQLELGYTRYPSKNLVLLFLLVGYEQPTSCQSGTHLLPL